MKYTLLFVLIFAVAPATLIAGNIKPEQKELLFNHHHTKIINAVNNVVPCCLVIAINSQNILFSIYDQGMANCSNSICTSYWIAFENAGEQNIKNQLRSCEEGDGADCGTLVM